MTLSEKNFDDLIKAIASRNIASMDVAAGSLFVRVDSERDLYATPGWEGGCLPYCLQNADGDIPLHGDMHVDWTNDLEQNIRLYKAALRELVDQAGN
tara:strand:+ start:1182 stop:1472 length:291 start_codon:yes stop_codon:yes gene_type:complete